MKNTVIIAVTGKGGVGKTSLSAVIVKNLVKSFPDKRILAIDADPAVGLSTALGVEIACTIDDIRRSIIDSVEGGDKREAIELLNEARFRIFDAMVERDGFAFIAVGRPEAAGCYCKVNAYLKDIIGILAEEFDYVVIDGEAGIEQVNRRVMEKVTHLLLVTDMSKKGRDVVATIKGVADKLVMYSRAGVIVNRVSDESLMRYLDFKDLPVLAVIQDDSGLSVADLRGDSAFSLPDDSKIVLGAKTALENIGIL